MKKSPRSHYEEKAGVSESDLIEAFDRVVREDHPNPKRAGCPGSKALKEAATSPNRTFQFILDHMAKCAPCLREYDRLRREQKMRGTSSRKK